MERETLLVFSEEVISEIIERSLEHYFSSHQISESKDDDEILTREKAAEYLAVSLVTLNTWTKEHEIPSRRIGGRVYYSKKELLELIRRGRQKNVS